MNRAGQRRLNFPSFFLKFLYFWRKSYIFQPFLTLCISAFSPNFVLSLTLIVYTSIRSILYSVHSTHYKLHSTLHMSLQTTLHTLLCTLLSPQYYTASPQGEGAKSPHPFVLRTNFQASKEKFKIECSHFFSKIFSLQRADMPLTIAGLTSTIIIPAFSISPLIL